MIRPEIIDRLHDLVHEIDRSRPPELHGTPITIEARCFGIMIAFDRTRVTWIDKKDGPHEPVGAVQTEPN